MPVLEAMACGLPVIATGGGPTDEFCPPEAGWRIRSHARPVPVGSRRLAADRRAAVGARAGPRRTSWRCCARPTAIPASAGAAARAGRAAAQRCPGTRSPRATPSASRSSPAAGRCSAEPQPCQSRSRSPRTSTLRVLATPAWRARGPPRRAARRVDCRDRPATTSACLYLLADPHVDGAPGGSSRRACSRPRRRPAPTSTRGADINVLMEPPAR